jgi:hypothetical protein
LISRWSGTLGVCAIVAVIRPAHADPRAVIELFTSQGCSSCPPADKLLGELAKDPSVIALSMPIDYWDYLGWKDTWQIRASARGQKALLAHARRSRRLYAAGRSSTARRMSSAAIASASKGAISDTGKRDGVMSVPVTMTLSGKQLTVTVAAGKDPSPARGENLDLLDLQVVPIAIGKGENRGREVTYHNVVRNLVKVGDWNGTPGSWTVPLESINRDGVDAPPCCCRTAIATSPGRCSARHSRRCTSRRFIPGHDWTGHSGHRCGETSVALLRGWRPHPNAQKRKGPTLVGPVSGIKPLCDRPDPDGPGGLGAEESGTERTGSTQNHLSQLGTAGGWRKWGNNEIRLTIP